MKYKVSFEGFVCVYADNPDEAMQKIFFDDDVTNVENIEMTVNDIEEVDDFEVEI